MKKYKLILLDADGTLFDFETSEHQSFKKAFEMFNLVYTDELFALYKKINAKLWSDFEKGLISTEDIKSNRFKSLVKDAELNVDDVELKNAYTENLSNSTLLLDGAESMLKNLSGKAKLSILTNGLTTIQRRRFGVSPIRQFIHSIIISEEVGYQKPHSEIFKIALRENNHSDKHDVLIIGDSLSSDIKGGYDFGIDTCWYNPKQNKNQFEIIPTFEVNHLDEISNIINN